MRLATDFGVRYTGLSWIPHKDVFTREDCLRAAESFNRWGTAAKEAGIRFVYHIHGYEFEPSPEGTLLDTLAQQTDPARRRVRGGHLLGAPRRLRSGVALREATRGGSRSRT